jgi:hypothetical protein
LSLSKTPTPSIQANGTCDPKRRQQVKASAREWLTIETRWRSMFQSVEAEQIIKPVPMESYQ